MRRRWPPILMYHALAPATEDPNKVCVSPARFEQQMAHLARRGLRGVGVGELVSYRDMGRSRGLVGLTFDDGYENFLGTAVPVLERFGFSATVFALGGMLGEENSWDGEPRLKLLDADGLREAAARGMEVGSHGHTHVRMEGLKLDRLRQEIEGSRASLGGVFGSDVAGFCYPYGSLDAAAVAEVKQAGYAYACAYKTRVSGDLHDLPRLNAGERDGGLRLALKLAGATRYVDAIRGRL